MQEIERLRAVCDHALHHCRNFATFVERIEAQGITVALKMADDGKTLTGLVYGFENREWNAEDLGTAYTVAAMAEQGITYQPKRDRALLQRQFTAKAEAASPSAAKSKSRVVARTESDLAATVRTHLEALGVDQVEIGIRSSERSKTTHRTWSVEEAVQAVPWLQAMNATGNDIYVRPADYGSVILLDDLDPDGAELLKSQGYEPAALVEISSGKYQAWLRLPIGVVVEEAIRATAARYFAHTFGADLKSAGAHHLGFLAGFANHNPKLILANREPSQVVLRHASGQTMSKGQAVIEQADRLLDYQGALRAQKERIAVIRSWVGKEGSDHAVSKIVLSPVEDYRRQAQNLLVAHGGEVDWSRLDRRVARDMLASGHYSRDQVVQAIVQGSPNISSLKLPIVTRDAQNLVDQIEAAQVASDQGGSDGL